MVSKKDNQKLASEFRQDPISGDWVLLAPSRGVGIKFEGRMKVNLPKNKCPFENPAKFGNAPAILVYQNESKNDWFLQVIPNKYPAVSLGRCDTAEQKGLEKFQAGVGFHEIVIYRDHDRHLADFTSNEIKRALTAFQERYNNLANDACVKYISIFHNCGKEAGSTVSHPHSQILALPVIPPDINHSINGSHRYFTEHGKCAHCQILNQELKDKKRVLYQNKSMVVFVPFASRTEFEIRIISKNHSAYFEKVEEDELGDLADALKFAFSKIYKKLKDPAFNFFIHTAPTAQKQGNGHYHWHVEILPKFDVWGGFELGTGMDIITLAPEKAAQILRK